MSELKRKIFTSDFKAKVALEAACGAKTLNEIGGCCVEQKNVFSGDKRGLIMHLPLSSVTLRITL